jgi:hypothetical protein
VRELEQAHRALAAQDVSTRMICRIISERIRRKELLPSLVED